MASGRSWTASGHATAWFGVGLLLALACEPIREEGGDDCERLCSRLSTCGYLPSVLGVGDTETLQQRNCRDRCTLSKADVRGSSEGRNAAGLARCGLDDVSADEQEQLADCEALADCLRTEAPGVAITGQGEVSVTFSREEPSTGSCAGIDAATLQLLPLIPASFPDGYPKLACSTQAAVGEFPSETVPAGVYTAKIKVVGSRPPAFDGGVATEPAISVCGILSEGPFLARAGTRTAVQVVLTASALGSSGSGVSACEAACADGQDNDGDGKADCDDLACDGLCTLCLGSDRSNTPACGNAACAPFCPAASADAGVPSRTPDTSDAGVQEPVKPQPDASADGGQALVE